MSKTTYSKMKITGITTVVPDYPRSIDDDIHEFDNSAAKLARAKKIVGYGTRYKAPPGCTPTDLASAAVMHLIEGLKLEVSEIDGLICVMQKPDYSQPGSSFIIHKEFGFSKNCACLDINQGCPGFVYGLWVAGSLLESGAGRKIIVTTGDYYESSPHLRARLLFGDAGAAALVEFDPEASKSYFNLGSDGNCFDSIIKPSSGARLPVKADILGMTVHDKQGDDLLLTDDYLDGLEVFNFSIREVPPNVAELFEYSSIKPEDIDFAAFHQANKQIVDHIATKSGLNGHQYSTATFSEYGNQSSASVPAVVSHLLAGKLENSRLKILLCAFGIGATWASCITDLDHIYCPGIIKEKFENLPTREELISYWQKRIGGTE